MRFGLIYHHQLPKPWAADSEERLYAEALEQIELADRLGLDYAWATEHHFFEEYSHSSAPEVFLAAVAARTKNIRIAHGIVHMPAAVNHPVRIAERLAMLDLISGGRLDFGSGQGSSQLEVGAFGIELKDKVEQWHDSLELVVRMMTETPFTGYKGRWVDIPTRNIIPKPKQKPHPPLWRACTRRDTIQEAAQEGLGALAFSFVNPEEAKEWVDAYYGTIESGDCVPVGEAVNPNVAMVLPFMCHPDEEVALDRGLEGAHFFSYALMHYYITGEHRPGITNIWEDFQQQRESLGFTRQPIVPDDEDLQSAESQAMMDQVGSLRRGIGTPEQIADIIRRYEEVGVDQIIFSVQIGNNKHEHIMESIELFAREIMPEFVEGREKKEAAKRARLEPLIEAALHKKVRPAPEDVSDFVIAPEMAAYGDDD
jgi:alkanesulfonate monooxygenase SsuD/methylene tetrahydromethanopterin reductase-like flavin-dependent oxidoreductase (luciferase family)